MTNPQSTATPTLLFVDDEANVLSALRRLFRQTPYRVLVAASGAEGLALLAKEQVDVVVSDMRMPEMDGATFLGHVARQWPGTVRLLLTGYADLESTIAAVNEGLIFKHMSKPWNDGELRQAIELALRQRSTAPSPDFASRLQGVRQELQCALESIGKNHTALFRVLTQLVDRREGSNGHSRRVAQWATRLAAALPGEAIHAPSLALAALFHDLGKIIESPDAADGDHACTGQTLLCEFEFLQEIALWVRHHHEHYDGTGTPDGLRGEAIPLGARILAIADDYDELQHGTLGSERLSAPAALRTLEAHRGSHYDPALVDAFLQLAGVGAATQ